MFEAVGARGGERGRRCAAAVAGPNPEGASRQSQDALDKFYERRENVDGGGECWVVVEVEGAEKGGSKAGGGVWLKHDDTRIQLSLFRNTS